MTKIIKKEKSGIKIEVSSKRLFLTQFSFGVIEEDGVKTV